MTQGEFFGFVIDVLEELKIPYMITGSVASMAYGIPRLTLDMDVVVDMSVQTAEQFCQKFDSNFYADLDSVLAAVNQKGHFNVIHGASGSKVDFFLLKEDPASRIIFQNRYKQSFDGKKEAFFSSLEDVIISKLRYYREGKSEKHLKDIEGILKVSGDKLNIEDIDERTKGLGLYQYWEELKNGMRE